MLSFGRGEERRVMLGFPLVLSTTSSIFKLENREDNNAQSNAY